MASGSAPAWRHSRAAAQAKIPADSGGRAAASTVAVPTTPDNPRADLYKELGDLGL